MKRRLFITLCVLMLTIFTIPAVQAATIVPVKSYLDPVHFYLVDTDGDDIVKISNTGNLPFDLNIDWSYDGVNWSDWSPSLMTFSKNDKLYSGVVYLSIFLNESQNTSGEVIFDGGGIEDNEDWYSSLLIYWSGEHPRGSFLTLKPYDAVSPIPITNSVLLLGSGVFGLIMMVSRKKDCF